MDIAQMIQSQMQKAGQPLVSKSTSTLTPPQQDFDLSILPLLIMAIMGGGAGGDGQKKGLGLPGNESWYGVGGGMGVGAGPDQGQGLTPQGLMEMLRSLGLQSLG